MKTPVTQKPKNEHLVMPIIMDMVASVKDARNRKVSNTETMMIESRLAATMEYINRELYGFKYIENPSKP